MGQNDDHMIRYSVGSGRNLGKATNQTKSLKTFAKLFAEPVRTKERHRDYLKLPEEDQKHLKSTAGWWYRTHVDGPVRNRGSGQPSDVVTFDFDYATPEFLQSFLDGTRFAEHEWLLHTSRRHSDEKPRFRLVCFLSSPIPNDHYVALSRILAREIDPDMEHVDKVSFRAAQMMFMPTASADQEYIFKRNEGSLIDPQDLLDTFELTDGDWHDISILPRVAGETELRQTAEKAEDPTEKQGPVGDFCRAYNIFEAIETFLPDKYSPVDVGSAKPRYTYLGGSTVSGAEVQDDGLFLYSHHGSDPVGDMLVNSFDLVRIHLFGDQDKPEDRDVPVTKRPSYLSMIDHIRGDAKFRNQQVKSRYDMAAMDFDDDDVEVGEGEEVEEEDPEIAELVGESIERDIHGAPISLPKAEKIRKKRPPPKDNWIADLDLTNDGRIISNVANIVQILDNDARTRNVLAFNEFTGRTVIRDHLDMKLGYIPKYPCSDKVSGTPVEDHHVIAIRMMLESPNGAGKVGYGLRTVSERDIHGAVDMVARRNAFHPVREYLESTKRVPGVRAESAFITLFGCPDTPYFREVSKLFFIGAVVRAFEPGHKFDFCVILQGAQGKRKSTTISILAKGWYGELKADFKDEKKLIEQMQGNWINELPELSSIGRSAVEDVKAFLAGTSSIVRLSYDRRSSHFARQGIFIGSTNDDEYLIDTTGNRRFWPVPVEKDVIDTDMLTRIVDAIWGDAYALYREMRALQPHGTLPLYLKDPESVTTHASLTEAARVGSESDSYAQVLAPWLDRKLGGDDFGGGKPRRRMAVTVSEAWMDGLEMSAKTSQADTRAVGKALRLCGWQTDGKSHRHKGAVTKVFSPGPFVLQRWALEDGAAADDADDLI